jgi:polysaccharide pyruvyl transferase WcaK-like protein
MRNTGDDVFCTVTAWGARKFWGLTPAKFLAPTVPDMHEVSQALLMPKRIFKGQWFIERSIHLLRSEWLVFAGGSLFHGNISSLSLKGFAKHLSRHGALKIGAIGVSLGPFTSIRAEQDNKEFLRRFSFLVLRDRKSFEIAESMNLPFQAVESRDLAFLIPQVLKQSTVSTQPCLEKRKPILGVTVCWYERFVNGDRGNEEKRVAWLVETLTKLDALNNIKLRFFIFNDHPILGDKKVTLQIATKFKPKCEVEVVQYSPNVNLTLKKIVECDAFFSTRLHGAIMAASVRVPFLLLEYHRKCADFLDDIDWPSRLRVGDSQLAPLATSRLLGEILTRDRDNLFPKMGETEELAELNFKSVSCFQC